MNSRVLSSQTGVEASVSTPYNGFVFSPSDDDFHQWRGKLPHVEVAGYAYLLTASLADGVTPLNPAERTIVLRAILHWHKRGWQHFAAVVMPTHLHLVTAAEQETSQSMSIAELMKRIKGSSARQVNKMRGSQGRLWLREYHDVVLRDEKALRSAVQYVLNNPVKPGLSEKPEDYPWLWTYWSGAKALLLLRDGCNEQEWGL